MPTYQRIPRSRRRRLAVSLEILIEIDPQYIIEDIRGDHDSRECRERHDLIRMQTGGKPRVQFVRNTVRIARDPLPEVDDGLLPGVERKRFRVFSSFRQRTPEKC